MGQGMWRAPRSEVGPGQPMRSSHRGEPLPRAFGGWPEGADRKVMDTQGGSLQTCEGARSRTGGDRPARRISKLAL